MKDREPREAADGAFLTATTRIVVAYLGCSSVPVSQISGVISTVHGALRRIGPPPVERSPATPTPATPTPATPTPATPTPATPAPAVAIRKSITADYLVCLEDGLRFKLALPNGRG